LDVSVRSQGDTLHLAVVLQSGDVFLLDLESPNRSFSASRTCVTAANRICHVSTNSLDFAQLTESQVLGRVFLYQSKNSIHMLVLDTLKEKTFLVLSKVSALSLDQNNCLIADVEGRIIRFCLQSGNHSIVLHSRERFVWLQSFQQSIFCCTASGAIRQFSLPKFVCSLSLDLCTISSSVYSKTVFLSPKSVLLLSGQKLILLQLEDLSIFQYSKPICSFSVDSASAQVHLLSRNGSLSVETPLQALSQNWKLAKRSLASCGLDQSLSRLEKLTQRVSRQERYLDRCIRVRNSLMNDSQVELSASMMCLNDQILFRFQICVSEIVDIGQFVLVVKPLGESVCHCFSIRADSEKRCVFKRCRFVPFVAFLFFFESSIGHLFLKKKNFSLLDFSEVSSELSKLQVIQTNSSSSLLVDPLQNLLRQSLKLRNDLDKDKSSMFSSFLLSGAPSQFSQKSSSSLLLKQLELTSDQVPCQQESSLRLGSRELNCGVSVSATLVNPETSENLFWHLALRPDGFELQQGMLWRISVLLRLQDFLFGSSDDLVQVDDSVIQFWRNLYLETGIPKLVQLASEFRNSLSVLQADLDSISNANAANEPAILQSFVRRMMETYTRVRLELSTPLAL